MTKGAQEQGTENPRVGSSILSLGTIPPLTHPVRRNTPQTQSKASRCVAAMRRVVHAIQRNHQSAPS